MVNTRLMNRAMPLSSARPASAPESPRIARAAAWDLTTASMTPVDDPPWSEHALEVATLGSQSAVSEEPGVGRRGEAGRAAYLHLVRLPRLRTGADFLWTVLVGWCPFGAVVIAAGDFSARSETCSGMISPAPVALLVPVANLNRRNAAACWASNPKRAVVYVTVSQGSICRLQ
jgi:hypothetical protein